MAGAILIPDPHRGHREVAVDETGHLVDAVSAQSESDSVSGLVACADGFPVEWQLPHLAMLP